MDSTNFDSYLPIYDVVPESWDDARPFLVETLKKISTAVNTRTIGFLLDEEILSGEAFYPAADNPNQSFRSVLRKVVMFPTGLVNGANQVAHGIVVDVNFTLISLWCAASNSTTFEGTVFANGDTISYDATNFYVTSNGTYDRANVFCTYIQEI